MRCLRQILDVCWWVHVSNAEVLQRSGFSTTGDIDNLRHQRLSLFGHVARLDPRLPATSTWCSASDGGYTYKSRRSMASCRRRPGRPRNIQLNRVQEDANALLLLSTLWRSEIAWGHEAAQRFTLTTRRRRWWWRMTYVKNGG